MKFFILFLLLVLVSCANFEGQQQIDPEKQYIESEPSRSLR